MSSSPRFLVYSNLENFPIFSQSSTNILKPKPHLSLMPRFHFQNMEVFKSKSSARTSSSSGTTISAVKVRVCWYWFLGTCERYQHCQFLHSLPEKADLSKISFSVWKDGEEQRHQSAAYHKATTVTSKRFPSIISIEKKKRKTVCKSWLNGSCARGDRCSYLHSWFYGEGFSKLSTLRGHNMGVKGITLTSSMDKLYSGSRDGTLRLWDCQNGQCSRLIKLAGEISSLISEGPWIFVGLTNVVKVWNTQNDAEFSLDGPVGQVQSMVVVNNMLFAGAQNGQIFAWRGSSETNNPFQPLTCLVGHSDAVTCLAVGGKRLFSGSVDNTIRVWDLDTLQCVAILKGHKDMVMSLICWDQYLLSCSEDGTIKVWATSQVGNIEVIYTHNEEHGALALCGIMDAMGKPILLCSCSDNSVRLYELPSFAERGRLFGKEEVWTIQNGPQGLFFTAEAQGLITVWKMSYSAHDN